MVSVRFVPLLLIAIMVVVAAPLAESEVTCSMVTSSLTPCITYLTGGALSQSCCSGISSLNAAAQTTADRQTACRCLKSDAANYPGIDVAAAAGLPAKCGVDIPYKISPSTDCNSVQ